MQSVWTSPLCLTTSVGVRSHRFFVEGGGTVNWSFLAGGYVDKVHAFIAPMLMGGAAAKTPVSGTGFDSPQTALHLHDVTVEQLGADILVTGDPRASAE